VDARVLLAGPRRQRRRGACGSWRQQLHVRVDIHDPQALGPRGADQEPRGPPDVHEHQPTIDLPEDHRLVVALDDAERPSAAQRAKKAARAPELHRHRLGLPVALSAAVERREAVEGLLGRGEVQHHERTVAADEGQRPAVHVAAYLDGPAVERLAADGVSPTASPDRGVLVDHGLDGPPDQPRPPIHATETTIIGSRPSTLRFAHPRGARTSIGHNSVT
jgi:hypothetical protein